MRSWAPLTGALGEHVQDGLEALGALRVAGAGEVLEEERVVEEQGGHEVPKRNLAWARFPSLQSSPCRALFRDWA